MIFLADDLRDPNFLPVVIGAVGDQKTQNLPNGSPPQPVRTPIPL